MPKITSTLLTPTWALLVPSSSIWLEEESQDMWEVFYGSSQITPERWQFVQGNGKYSAVVDFIPGSESTETELADFLFKKLNETIFILWFREDFESSWAYSGSKNTTELLTPPLTLAEELGCSLRRLFD
jgi:hypothetical protein